jgi:hypothetical protein
MPKPKGMKKAKVEKDVVELQLSSSIKLVAQVDNWKGKKSLDIRQHWLPDGEDGYKPTVKGVKIPIEKSKLFWIKVKRILQAELGE